MNMLNIINKKYLLRLALLSIPLSPVLTSCADDFLDVNPRTSASVETAFNSVERIEAQANGLYSTLKSGVFLGGRYQIYTDIRADEFVNRLGNGVTGAFAWQQNLSPDDTYMANFWIQGYLTINRANLFLEGVDANASTLDATVAQNYKGEAKFVRALAYFSLVQMYAKPYVLDNGASPGLPLRLQGETTIENNGLARSTVAQVYTQILKDLDEAEQELRDDYGSPSLNTTRAHKNTAIALKTRVYLTMGNYEKVIEEGNKIVSQSAPFTSPNRVAHALQPDIKTVFTNFTTTESILSFPMTANSAPGLQNQLGFYYNQGNREYYLNQTATGTTPGIYANPQFRAEDDRKTELTATLSGQVYLTKFSGVSPFIDWVPIIRYSEVMLNLAEAEAEVGDQDRALALLLAVHQRSDAGWTFTPSSQQELVNTILTERRIELLGEGFRVNDVMRRGQAIPSVGASSLIEPTDSRYQIPIPTREIQTNPLF